MKILVVGNSSSGLFEFRSELLERLKKENNEIYAVIPFDYKIDELKSIGINLIDVKVDRRGKNILKDFLLFMKYYSIIKKINPEIVITYTIKPNIYCGIICELFKLNYFVNITGLGSVFYKENIVKKIVIFLYKISLKNVKKVFFENIENKNVFIDNSIINNERSVLLSGAGVNLSRFQYTELKKKKETTFIFIGRIMKEKGIEEFFFAAKKMKEIYNNCRFIILGDMEEKYSQDLKKLIRLDVVEYNGLVKDVRPYIKESDCCVLPSYHEGMSNTLLECGAMGRAIITSNINGCRETVIENESGYLVDIGDKEGLYMYIEKFFKLSYEEKKIMGINSRKHIEKYFNRKDVVNSTVNELMNK